MLALHLPVLLSESIQSLAPASGAVLLDGTVGLGGHSSAWLGACAEIEGAEAEGAAAGLVIGIDRDAQALARAAERLEAAAAGRSSLHHGSYEQAPEFLIAAADVLPGVSASGVDAALLDLGASSLQLDDAERGFSFRAPGPLDMRMDRGDGDGGSDGDDGGAGETAADIVNRRTEAQLAQIFRDWGEEPSADRIARAIVAERRRAPFRDTLRLAETVAQATGGRRGRLHPATRVFQALRIAVNDELGRVERGLPAVAACVRAGGRFAVLTFHRLEDRLVKAFFRAGVESGEWRDVTQATADRVEVRANPRSRSARLRVAERVRAADGVSGGPTA